MPKCEIATSLHCAAIFLIDSGGCIVLQLYVVYEVAFSHKNLQLSESYKGNIIQADSQYRILQTNLILDFEFQAMEEGRWALKAKERGAGAEGMAKGAAKGVEKTGLRGKAKGGQAVTAAVAAISSCGRIPSSGPSST